jgi:hypothetical protein
MTRWSANYKTRLVVAFCVAPLVVPVSVFISFRDDLLWALNLALAGVILAYWGLPSLDPRLSLSACAQMGVPLDCHLCRIHKRYDHMVSH